MADLSQYTLPNDTGVCLLECTNAFNALTDREKLYSHYISQASFAGGLIVLIQTSPESPGIFVLLQKVFRGQSLDDLKKIASDNGVNEEEFQAFLIYAAGFYANMGNYKSFGDSKFVPRISKEKFEKIILNSEAAKKDGKTIQGLWNRVSDRIFSLEDKQKELGLGSKGTSTYFSGNCDNGDADIAQEFLNKMDISAYNTRLFKTEDPSTKKPRYEVRLASSETQDGVLPGYKTDKILGEHQFTPSGSKESILFTVTRGDYSPLMKLVCENLALAKNYAANDNEVKMLEEYIKSFTTGSLPSHKDGSRHWIKNTSPIVETYIGFIESYRDPYGVRGEFEGFAAVVNKQMSKKFGDLVSSAEHLLAHLPWPSEYEKDTFLRPDFTSLDVLSFGGSGIPAGINIPNYNDIRQDEGFKNVSLGNVLTSGYKDTKITFLNEADKELYVKWKLPSFEVQVGLHELLGHGSGKLFIKDKNGKFNFDIESVTHTETGQKISKWYEHNETWDSKFTTVAASYEECRAECVGLYLCLSTDVLKIFSHVGDVADDIIYINWLNMVRAGLIGLEFYSPETGKWKQAHMNARFAILRVLLEAGEDFVKIEKLTGEDGNPDLRILLDRSKIISVGKPAIGKFLCKLQVYKTTGDYEEGKMMYDFYSDVNDTCEPHFLSLRKIVMARKQPRKMFVQHNTVVKGESADIVSYEASAGGLIQSFQDRFPSTDIDNYLQTLWDKDAPHF